MKAAQAAGEEAPPGVRSVKMVLVGDGGCGKTSLLMVFAEGAFPESYTPTVFERLTVNLQIKGKPVHLQIWDTAGQVDYDRLRPLFYPDASVLLLCFDVTSPHSFDNIFNRGDSYIGILAISGGGRVSSCSAAVPVPSHLAMPQPAAQGNFSSPCPCTPPMPGQPSSSPSWERPSADIQAASSLPRISFYVTCHLTNKQPSVY
ncbi:rho-related GTP-binding protein RhoD isoform X2 [Rhinolophus sinicus]|uniref:rho-related GTP-binding protein RhoD isoform X2 n=1 Tax=Rhinolophus sinicus TaxID=89399 RepID=UPI003D78D809